MKPKQANFIAAVWGMAEATVFVIVPDVFLSWVALRRVREGLIACIFALLGALLGGAVMWLWGRNDPASARAFLASLPAISGTMIDGVNQQLADTGIYKDDFHQNHPGDEVSEVQGNNVDNRRPGIRQGMLDDNLPSRYTLEARHFNIG